jgi:hypothetical protein
MIEMVWGDPERATLSYAGEHTLSALIRRT